MVALSFLERDVTVHRLLYALGGTTVGQTTMSRINHWHTCTVATTSNDQ